MKTKTKKLRDGPVIAVDMQIVRWRKKMKKKGIELGSGMRRQTKLASNRRAEIKEKNTVTDEKLLRKNWFE